MNRLIIALIFVGTCAFAQLPPLAPSLEQIKIAADAGDPVAQDKLTEYGHGNGQWEGLRLKVSGFRCRC